MTTSSVIVGSVSGLLGAYVLTVFRVLDQTATGPITDWERIIGNLGIPVGFMVFMAVLAFKLWPHLIEWVKGQTAMSRAVVSAMPAIARLTPEEIGRILRAVIAETRQLDAERIEQLDARIRMLTDRLTPK